MLKFLHIENIAVIERSDIEFQNGFNVLTGETGAGKSILIDAINAVLGERTSKDLIRAGCDEALVTALFSNLSVSDIEALNELGIFPDEDGNILISRRLSLTGKGYIKINDIPFTASLLRSAAGILINIHGQHDNQALLNPQFHCNYIDLVAKNEKLLSDYYSEFKKLNNIRRELSELETDEDEKLRKTELLKYQINELESADIKLGELEELKAKLKLAENFENRLKCLSGANSAFYGNEDTDGIISMLKNVSKQLSLIKDDEFDNKVSTLNDILSSLTDIAADTASALFDAENNEYNANVINQRLDYMHRLMLKYGNSESLMLEFLDNAKKELESISCSEKRLNELEIELEASKQELIKKAEKLSKSRINASKEFEAQVCAVLSYLNMPNVRFKVGITQGRYTKDGCDEVEFLLSANLGENLKPLSKIASGGELSRVMLSIKSCLLEQDSIPTMIFDEIDTGISGFAADRVASQLKKVSGKSQVICVTHLAQLAAACDNHLLIEKSTRGDRTYTEVKALDYEGRINEIARIMSGTQITDNLYNSAKELIDRSF